MATKYNFFNFSQVHINWTWQELLYGIENNFIFRNDVINYATYILKEELMGFDLVLEIAIADEYEDISLLLYSLSILEKRQKKEEIEDKWRYVILKELCEPYEKKLDDDNFNERLEEVYANFDYPEDMAGFIRYMPLTEGKSRQEAFDEYFIKSRRRFDNSKI